MTNETNKTIFKYRGSVVEPMPKRDFKLKVTVSVYSAHTWDTNDGVTAMAKQKLRDFLYEVIAEDANTAGIEFTLEE